MSAAPAAVAANATTMTISISLVMVFPRDVEWKRVVCGDAADG
jgi:hypothetical protein